jgi:uncharacterized protein (TIGR00369 family)
MAAHIELGRSIMEMNVDDRHANPMGTLHGGVICDLSDAAKGTAFATTLEDDESFTTLDLGREGIQHLRGSARARGNGSMKRR